MAARPPHSYVLRDSWMAAVFWIAVAGTMLLLGDTLLRGAWAAFAVTTEIAGFALWVLWMVLYRPHLRYDEQRVVVTNIGRIVDIPWSRVVSVSQRLNLSFRLDDGRVVRAFGVTAPRERGIVLGTLTRGKEGAGSDRFHDRADDLERFRDAAARDNAPAVVRWDIVPLVVGAVLAVSFAVGVIALILS